jgi:hypothetical protein
MDENNNDVFEQYLKPKSSLKERLKQPKFWTILVVVLAGIFLAVQYYLINVKSLSSQELKDSIEIVWSESKWVNKEVSPYGVTIVPSFTFKIKNKGPKSMQYVKFIGIFSFEDSGQQFSDGFIITFKKPLEPGETSEEIFLKAFNGYKASSKESFFENREGWKKIKMKLFAGTSARPVELGIFPISQQIEGIDEKKIEKIEADESEKRFNTEGLQKAVQIRWSDSFWVYKPYSPKEIVIVPSIKIKVKNLGDSPLRHVSFKGIFEVENTGKVFSQGMVIALNEPLNSGMVSDVIHIKSEYGYTVPSIEALEKNKTMMENIIVRVFAKVKESDDVLLGVFPVKGIIRKGES